jgi:hypothetical protein
MSPHIPDVLLVLLMLLATGTGGEEILFKSRARCDLDTCRPFNYERKCNP